MAKVQAESLLELALLGLVLREQRSGYALRKVFAETALGGNSSSPGAIYPALKRQRRQMPEGIPPHPGLALDNGSEQFHGHACWAVRALQAFDARRER